MTCTQLVVNPKASHEIFLLAKFYQLEHVALFRECQYLGVVNGQNICVSVFDRDANRDLHALKSAINTAITAAT